MKVKRIAIIVNSLSRGGAERVSVLLAEWLYSKGVECAIFTIKDDDEDSYPLNSNISRISMHNTLQSGFLTTVKKLRHSIKKFEPSVALIMGVPLSVYAIPALLGTGIPIVVSERNSPLFFKGKKSTQLFSKLLVSLASGFVFQTKGAKEYYSKKIQSKSVIIPNPLTLNNLLAPYKGKRTKKIVSVGRLVPQKNHSLLINAFSDIVKEHPDYTLTIYGEGSEKNTLNNLIKSLNLSGKVILAGVKKDIFKEINDAAMFVMSSNFEGMPNALIEAMALGVPVISTNCPSGGPASLIIHKYNGLLTSVGDQTELMEAMKSLIIDDKLSGEISNNSVKIRDELDSEKVCSMWLNYLGGLQKENA